MLDKAFKVYKKYNLRNRQRKLNKEYAENGLNDEILNEQIKINSERNEHNIVDEEEIVYDGFVQ